MKAILVSSEAIGVSQIDRKINVCLWVVCMLLLLLKGMCCKILVSISVDFSKTWLQLPFSPWVAEQEYVGLAFRWSRVRVTVSAASRDLWPTFALWNTWSSGDTAMCRAGGNGQSIGSTVSDAIVRSWMWSTATGRSPLGCFSRLLQVVDNWLHILCE